MESVYTYDPLGRVKTQTLKGIAAGSYPAQHDVVTTHTLDPDGRKLGETISAGGLTLTKSTTYDKTGRIDTDTDAAGLVTNYDYTNGGRTETLTRAGGATQITDKFLDGRTKSVTGTAVVTRTFDYGVNGDGTQYSREYVGPGGLSSPRWTKTTTDWSGHTIKTEKPAFAPGTTLVQSSIYNTLGQLVTESVSVGSSKLLANRIYQYDSLGNQIRAGFDLDYSNTLTAASADRYTESDSVYEKSGSDWFLTSTSKTYLKDNDATATFQIQKQRLTNFPTNGAEKTVAENTSIDVAGNQTKATTNVDRAAKKLTQVVDLPDSNLDSISTAINGLLQSSSPTTPETATTYTYDALRRLASATSPRIGVTTTAYNATTGQIASQGQGGNLTTFSYHPSTNVGAGRVKSETNAAGKSVYFNYSDRGELIQTWGDTTYPLEYVYDTYGQRTELHTYRGGSGWTSNSWPTATTGTADLTKWILHPATGLLDRKEDAATKQTVYTYDGLGRLKTRTWARVVGSAITTTYSYDSKTGEMTVVDYSDSTADVTFAYDRGGRQSAINDAAGTHTITYNAAGSLRIDQIASGILDGVKVDVGYDTFLRRNSLQATRNAATLLSQTYTYDTSGRLGTVVNGGMTATYAYYPTSGLLNTTTFTGGTNTARSYDTLGRLQSITNTPSGGGATSYTYTYNNLNQRTRVTREDGSYWSYGYNNRGELTSGKKTWGDTTLVSGQQAEFDYDNIGNRNLAKAGGDAAGANLRQSTYSANNLNQYTQRTVPGAVDIIGTAATAAAVTVNDQQTYRRGDYFHKALALDNGGAPVYAQLNIVGAKNAAGPGGEDAVTQKSGYAFLPKAVEPYTYDADGNLVSDGRFTYVWDAENRLVRLDTIASVPAAAKKRLEFAYDYMGRRIQKKVYMWNNPTSTYQLQSVTKFVYEGWNLTAELNSSGVLARNYVWGVDLSGSLQGVAGIGGLLFITEGGNTHHAGYDGNGNLTSLTNSSTGTLSASYEYAPFGETLKSIGSYSASNPFKFSTKYTDQETGLVYYGYRYYNPETGRWISKDPIDESGGINLYGFVTNNGISYTDTLGLAKRSLVGDTLMYTCNCGWIDLGHMNPENARELLDKVKASKGKKSLTGMGSLVEHSQRAGVKIFGVFLGYSVGGEYFVKYNLSPGDQESVALGIFKEVSELMERRQSGRFQDSITNSGFSGEDLVSNLLSFYRAARGYTRDQILALCKPLSKEISLKIWDANNGIRKSRSWRPVFYDDLGCCKDKPQWPRDFDAIEEAPKAHLWKWRDWEAGVDHHLGRRYR